MKMKRRILVIDRQELLYAGIASTFSVHRNFSITRCAPNVTTALRQVAVQVPDIAILDPWQPDPEGCALLPELREKHPSLRLLVLTDNDNAAAVNLALQYRANGYMLKRSPANDLLAAVETLLDDRVFLHPDVSHALVSESRERENNRVTLTLRQEQVLRMIAEGKTVRQIASTLGLSAKTVESHRVTLMNRLGIHHVPGLVRFAIRYGYIKLDAPTRYESTTRASA